MKQSISFLAIVVSLVILIFAWFIDVSAQNVVASPLLDSPLPTPIVTPVSPEADAALKFISEQQSIPVEELRVAGEEPVEFTLLSRDYTLITILHDLSDTFREFSLFVDPTTLQIEPDVNAIWAFENAAHLAKYGKLDVALYERLETIGDETTTPIVIWAAHTDTERSHEELVAELVSLYPEAAKALAEQGVAWAIADPDLCAEIEQKYNQLLTDEVSKRVQPIIEWLKAKGYEVEEFPGMPSVAATVAKRVINELGNRDDILLNCQPHEMQKNQIFNAIFTAKKTIDKFYKQYYNVSYLLHYASPNTHMKVVLEYRQFQAGQPYSIKQA